MTFFHILFFFISVNFEMEIFVDFQKSTSMFSYFFPSVLQICNMCECSEKYSVKSNAKNKQNFQSGSSDLLSLCFHNHICNDKRYQKVPFPKSYFQKPDRNATVSLACLRRKRAGRFVENKCKKDTVINYTEFLDRKTDVMVYHLDNNMIARKWYSRSL